MASWPSALKSRLQQSVKNIRNTAANITRAFPVVEGRCEGCFRKQSRRSRLHNRTEGQCKDWQVPESEWEPVWTCPGCTREVNGVLRPRPRGHPDHTNDPTACRMPSTRIRTETLGRGGIGAGTHPREARVPAEADRHANASGSHLQQDEEADPVPIPAPQDDAGGPASSSSGPDGAAPASRGPDKQPRFPETPQSLDDMATDWSKFDIDSSLRTLRHGNESQQMREVRKLHLRWWHGSRSAMERFFRAGSLPQATIDMIRNVIATCRICRAWALPSPEVTPSLTLVDQQDVEIEADILMFKQFLVWHMIDVCDRWHAAAEVKTKDALALQEAICVCWTQTFGPFKRLVTDGEKGIDSESTRKFLTGKGIELKVRAKTQHARTIERRGAILRHTMHCVYEQL